MSVEGIDVSLYQGDITHLLVGLDFAIVKASQSYYADPKAAAHFEQAATRDVVRGAYHWLDPQPSAEEQAQVFLAHAGPAEFLALDVEGRVLADIANARRLASAFISYVHAHDRRRIGLYSSRGTWPGDCGSDFRWVADYSGNPDRLALRLLNRGLPWTFWQYAGTGVDRDRYIGTIEQLHALAGRPSSPTGDAPLTGDSMTNLVPLTTHRAVDIAAGVVLYKTPGGDVFTHLTKPVRLGLLGGAGAGWYHVADGDAGVYVKRTDAAVVTADLNVGV